MTVAAKALGALPAALAWEEYTLFPGWQPPVPVFVVTVTETGTEALITAVGNVPIAFRVPASGIKPGHGLLMLNHLHVSPETRMLDLGCGPLALHAVACAHLGASEVVALEGEDDFAEAADGILRGFPNATVSHMDYLRTMPSGEFDLMTFHPPMLPVLQPEGGSLGSERRRYHFGGADGRSVLDAGLEQAARQLSALGELVIGQFEFLGVSEAFGEAATTRTRLAELGLEVASEHYYDVPFSLALEAVADGLREMFPRYPFFEMRGRWHHRFAVVVARRALEQEP